MKFFILPFLFLTLISHAQTKVGGCGTYEYKGRVIIKEKKMNLFINEGTNSELKFYLGLEQEAQLAPYLNKQVEGNLRITKVMDGTLATGFKILNARRAGSDPLHPQHHSYLKIIESQKCE